MKHIVLAAAVALALTGPAALAQESQEPQEEPARETKICRTDRMTGSLTRRTRICMTEAEWRELNARTQRGVDEMNREAAGSQQPCAYDNPDVICH